MKPKKVTPVVLSARCTYRTDTGRRCRLSVSDAHSSLCRQHLAELLQEQSADHRLQLIRNFQGFQTAQGINHSLKHLYELLAQNRISPRRAAVLSYISSLLLRTLPAIAADNAAGITYPAEPVPIDVLVPDKDLGPDEDPEPDPAPEPSVASSPTPHKPRVSDSADTWDPAIPEPDPSKKPS